MRAYETSVETHALCYLDLVLDGTAFLMVMTLSLLTFIAWAMRSPTCLSPFAEMVATWVIPVVVWRWW